MKKRIGSLLMALVLALSLVPATVWAADGATEVGTFEQLQAAIASDADTIDIVVTNDIELTQELTISSSKKDITIRSQEGSTYKLLRSASFQASADDYKSEYAFRLKAGKLTFKNIILDGNKDAVTAKNTFVFVSGSNDTQLTLGRGQGGGRAAALLSSTRPVEEASEPSALTDMISRSRSVNFSVNGLRESFTRSSSALACGTT